VGRQDERPADVAWTAEPPAGSVSEAVTDAVAEVVAAVKPRLRGWLHAGTFPVALVAGIVLVCLVPGASTKVAAAVYSLSAALLFGVSAVYHRGTWSPRVTEVLKRFDHANIFLIIAGSNTPFALLLLPPDDARLLLAVVWGGALVGVVLRLLWVGAPRWAFVPLYLLLGWAAVLWFPAYARTGGPAVLTCIIVGGLLYSLGAVVYGTKRPNPSPRWFGFHEVFHAFTLVAFAVQHVGVWLAAFGVGTAVAT
jgi:hemolysin III